MISFQCKKGAHLWKLSAYQYERGSTSGYDQLICNESGGQPLEMIRFQCKRNAHLWKWSACNIKRGPTSGKHQLTIDKDCHYWKVVFVFPQGENGSCWLPLCGLLLNQCSPAEFLWSLLDGIGWCFCWTFHTSPLITRPIVGQVIKKCYVGCVS